jgi:hypothetical protein
MEASLLLSAQLAEVGLALELVVTEVDRGSCDDRALPSASHHALLHYA